MQPIEYVIGAILLLLAIGLIVLIGLQQSKRKSGLSNSIAGQGASESYLTRNKIASKESLYKKITLIVAIVFVVLVIALYIVGTIEPSDDTSSAATSSTATSSTAASSVETVSSEAASSVEASVESSVEAASSEAVSE